MTHFILSIFIIISFFVFNASAQTIAERSFEKGIKAAQGGKYEAALADFRAALGFSSNETTSNEFLAKIHFNIGVCLYRTERSAEAVTELESAIRLSRGEYEKAFYSLGMAQTSLKNWQKAEEAFLAAIKLNAKNGETWLDLAFVYLAGKNYQAARAAFDKAIEHRTVDASLAHNNLGVILALGGDLSSAVREFETAVQKSNGELKVAGRNLEFCRELGQNYNRELLAKLEFTN